MKFMIITLIPQKQTLLGVSAEKHVVEECEAESLTDVVNGAHVPHYGEVYIINMDDVTTVKSEVITRVLPKGKKT